MKKLFCYVFICGSMLSQIASIGCKAQSAVFDIEYSGFSPEAESAFDHGAELWANYLVSDIPIKVKVHFTFLLPGQLGITFPNGELNFPGAPVANVWYGSCLANAISGDELNIGEVDMEIFLNTSASWYFGLDGNPGPGQYDLVSTAMHEIGHGLGILSLSNKILTEGSFGIIPATAFSPLTTSFPWPELDTLPSIFDTFLETEDGGSLISLLNPSEPLAAHFTGGNIYFNGPKVLEDNLGLRARIYAPGTFTLGSSISHWNEATYPVGNANELMTPQAAPAHASHTPGPLTLAALDDIGWEINYDTTTVSINTLNEDDYLIYPNPASDKIFIQNITNKDIIVKIFDANGRILNEYRSGNKLIEVYVKELNTGIYFIRLHDQANNNIFNSILFHH